MILFTVPLDGSVGIIPGETVTIVYNVEYDPECETSADSDRIENFARVISFNNTAVADSIVLATYMQELSKCQLSVCKVNFDDTTNPAKNTGGPSAADCTNPSIAQPNASLAFFPSSPSTQTFTIFYQNLSSVALNVGTVRDVLSVCSTSLPCNSLTGAAYGSFPVHYVYSCDFLPAPNFPLGAPYTNAPLGKDAMVQWNNPLFAGVRAIDIGSINFPPASTLMCKLTVSTLSLAAALSFEAANKLDLTGNLPAPTPDVGLNDTGCQDAGLPFLANSAFMDLTQGIFFNSSDIPPTPFGQAKVYLPLCQNVAVTKQGNTDIGVGQPDSFSITATNNQSDPVSLFKVTDPLPTGFIYADNFSCSPTPCPGQPISISPVTVILPTIPAGQSETVTFTATAPLIGGTWDNIATGTFASPTTCPPFPMCDPAGSYSKGSLMYDLQGRVKAPKLTKAFSSSSVAVGTPITLTFTITNVDSNPPQSGIGFTDTLPSGLSYVLDPFIPPFTTTCGGTGLFSPPVSPNKFTFSNGALSASTCTVTVRVVATSCGLFTNNQSNITNVTFLDATGVLPATLQVSCDAFIEICKLSSSTNPVTGNFTFMGSPPFTSIPGNSVMVPVDKCSGPIQVAHGPVTITEVPQPGTFLSAVTASGYNPITFMMENRLAPAPLPNPNLPARTATVTAVAGDTSVATIATFTNQGLTGSLKICKIAGAGLALGTSFALKVTSTNPVISQTYNVPAGPPSEGGYCVIDSTTFPVGSTVTVSETVPALGYNVDSVASPAGTKGTCVFPNFFTANCSIKATIGTGFTEVTFTNTPVGFVNFNGNLDCCVFSGTLSGIPITQTFTLTNTPPVPFVAGTTISSGPEGWLTVNPPQGQTPAPITVSVAALPAGTYDGAVTIASTDPANPLRSIIPVTYVVAAAGTISVANAASFVLQVSPGSLATVFGNGSVLANTTITGFPMPLPLSSNGTSVTMNGIACPLLYLSPTQINVQVPVELQPGTATVVVNNNGVIYTTTVPVVAASPGIFTSDYVATAILQDANGVLLTQNNPAKRGQVVVMYAAGIGPVSPAVATNRVAGVPLSKATSTYSVTVNDTPAQVDFVGLTPGFVGLGQINFRIPGNTPAGNTIPVTLTINGVNARTVQISVSGG